MYFGGLLSSIHFYSVLSSVPYVHEHSYKLVKSDQSKTLNSLHIIHIHTILYCKIACANMYNTVKLLFLASYLI